jgi:hypothetical protein
LVGDCKTYAPVGIEAVRNTYEARLQGRAKLRARNETGPKVSTPHPIGVPTEKPSVAKPVNELERVKGIEPSSSAWKALDKANVFNGR